VRYVAMGLAVIASIGQLLPLVLLAVLVPSCRYLAHSRILRPVAYLLFPIIAACAVVFYPFWVLAMASNSYLLCAGGVRGDIEEGGIRLTGRRLTHRSWLPWAEIRSIRWELTPPLGAHYLVGLRDGSEVRVDFLPFDSQSEACEQVRRRMID
jgi:amino acid transporter